MLMYANVYNTHPRRNRYYWLSNIICTCVWLDTIATTPSSRPPKLLRCFLLSFFVKEIRQCQVADKNFVVTKINFFVSPVGNQLKNSAKKNWNSWIMEFFFFSISVGTFFFWHKGVSYNPRIISIFFFPLWNCSNSRNSPQKIFEFLMIFNEDF